MPGEIVRCAVHPAVGIARVGNAPADEYLLAPEIPGRAADPGDGGTYKNARGQIRREAARFRVYGYDAAGEVVGEITAGDAEITWEVHLANRKAAWYQFLNALDLKQLVMIPGRRNADVPAARRRNLVVDPGPRTITGAGVGGPQYAFDDGWISFREGSSVQVPLGEIRTDAHGRLLVIGGAGTSASYTGSAATTFANNDGWYDDTSDGTVRATVRLGGRTLVAEPAMVAVTPPNYGQGLHGPVTLHDVVHDLHVRRGWTAEPERLTFWEHIHPILARLAGNQWVNQGVWFLFGAGSPSDLDDPAVLERLADPGEESEPARRALFEWFRRPPAPWDEPGPRGTLPPAAPAALPPFYGDGVDYTGLAVYDLAVTPTQYERLRRWADGQVETGERPDPPAGLDDVPLAQQPSTLDRAPLDDCLGGPFHPGIELTWTMRVPRMWRGADAPFRLRILDAGVEPDDDYGASLTPETALGDGGPLDGSGPGTLTRWMGVPWQTDEASCLAGYNTSNYLPLPSFWAARVPNQVLAAESFARLADAALPQAQRLKHLGYRQFWLRDLDAGGAYQDRINNMVRHWHAIGVVAEQPAPADAAGPGWPDRYWVETGRAARFTTPDATFEQVERAERPDGAGSGGMARPEVTAEVAAEALPVRTEAERAAQPHPRRHPVRRDR